VTAQPDPDDGELREVQATTVRPSGIRLLSLDEVLDRPRAPWAILRVVRRRELVGIYANPSDGKTLVALLLALCFASGAMWFGYGVQAGPVLYLAGEGTVGIGNRLRAAFLGLDRGRDAVVHPVHFMLAAIPILSDAEFNALLEEAAKLALAPVLIIIDPMARFMGDRDENLALDMGLFIQRCEVLRDRFDATVIVLHHTGKDGTRERGSTAWRAAMDVVLRVTRDGRCITLRGDKAKDAEELPPIHAEIRIEWLGLDEFDEPVHSVRLVQIARPNLGSNGQEKPPETPVVALRKAMAYLGDPSPADLIYNTAGVSKSRFYLLIKTEEEEGRVRRTKQGRTRFYELTDKADEYVPPPDRPASRPSSSRGTNDGTDPLGTDPSPDCSVPPPLGADGQDGRTGSRSNPSFGSQVNARRSGCKRTAEEKPNG
jgi:hypothetical protein